MTQLLVFETSFSGRKITFGRSLALVLISFVLSGCGIFNMNIDTMQSVIRYTRGDDQSL